MRKMVVAGNWKMNKTPSETKKLIEELKPMIHTDKVEVIFCVPSVSLTTAREAVGNAGIRIGAENMFYEEKGAFTGEIAPAMLTDIGVTHVIIGHSERRQYFGETDEMINRKVRKAIEHNLTPIICCGETLKQREDGTALSFVRTQIRAAYYNVTREAAMHTIVAYEPIWAIGTGKVAADDQAEEACAAIRADIQKLYDEEVAQSVRILYGGSVNASNAEELFAMPNIDGGLVGGASLRAEFAEIVEFGAKVRK